MAVFVACCRLENRTFMREMLRESRQFLSRDSHSESDLLSSAIPLICSGQKDKVKKIPTVTTCLQRQHNIYAIMLAKAGVGSSLSMSV